MEDVLEVYHRPFDPARPQGNLDEAAKQPLAEVRAPLPIKPGNPERVDNEYAREGTAALFLVCEPLAGKRHVFGKRNAELSITHKYDADLHSQHEVGKTAHASLHDQITRWRIFFPG